MKTKKWVLMAGVCVLCAVALLAAVGVASAEGTGKGGENDLPGNLGMGVDEPDGTETVLAAPTVDFSAQYIRTNGSHEGVAYPVVKIIRSVRELSEYCEANKENYDLMYPYSGIGFLDACDRYDDAYFEDHILVMVLLAEGSGSIRHQVQSVHVGGDGRYRIDIDRIAPEECTDDTAAWHILIEPEAGVKIGSESDVTVFVDGVDPHTQPELVRYSRGYANVSLTIPDGWVYQTGPYEGNDEFFIAFWPAGRPEGKIWVLYYDSFGVCGTGLETEQITLGGYEARKDTYDGHKVWDFIRLIGTPGCYVIENEGATKWWDEYGDGAMKILNTLVVGDGIISEAKAVAIAKGVATVEYNTVWTSYDSETGLWTVTFGKSYPGGDQTVTITCEGKVTNIQYGE